MNDADAVTQFAGLTRHNNTDITSSAGSIAGIDSDDPPEVSFAAAVRALESADTTTAMWEVPDEVASHIDPSDFNDQAPDGTRMVPTDDGLAVKTERFQSIISPEKLRAYTNGNFTEDDQFQDALWHNPTKDYSVINPGTAYSPLEEAIRDEDLGDSVFGEIREYRGGGRVHMDVLFDAYQIDYNDDGQGRDPIVLGIRSGYDFFGDTALYFEGFAQDTRCSNSIRALTEKKVIRHVGDQEDLEEDVQDILQELGVMTDRLAELIEMAQDIELELLELNLSEPFDHDDHLRAFYELAGFPSYLASSAASHARTRADNQFLPDMTEVWDGATYALTHEFRGGEDTSRARELVQTASDMVQNPTQVIDRVERDHRRRMTTDTDAGEQATLDGESAHAAIEAFNQTVQDKADEFESTQEELRQTLVGEAGGDDAVATDGGQQ